MVRLRNGDGLIKLSQFDVCQIEAQNSVGFLKAVFDCYRRRQVFSINRNEAGIDGMVDRTSLYQLPEPLSLGWVRPDYAPFVSNDPAQIVFTSGTEGPPKAIVLSYRNLADVDARLNDVMELTDEVREYVGVPVTYSFGLGRARAVGAANGSLFLPERFDPAEIRKMLEADEINAISAVPSLWRSITKNPNSIGAAGDRVRWIEIGSQFMPEQDKEALKSIFPNARIIQHYGLTEASRSTFLDISRVAKDELGSVGRPNKSVEVKIVTNGAIAIRGDHVALGTLDKQGNISRLTDADGWFVTKDRGELRSGALWYDGRLDDQINIGGLKIGAESIESFIVDLLPKAAGHFAITAISDNARGEVVLLAYEEGLGDLRVHVETAARTKLAKHSIDAIAALKTLEIDALPRTETNKVKRSALRDIWSAHNQAGAGVLPALDIELSDIEADLAKSWRKVIGPAPITSESSFYDGGGDSLSALQVGLVMETDGWSKAAVRATFEGRPLSEIACLADSSSPDDEGSIDVALPDRTIRTWSLSLVRGFMVLTVLLSHWAPGLFNRLGIERQAEVWLTVLYRAGTPGFATVFGIGVGYFMLSDFTSKRDSVLSRLRFSFYLILAGVVLMAAISLLNSQLKGENIGGLKVAHAFYSILSYYLVILGTAPFWLPRLARLNNPMAALILSVPIMWIIWQVFTMTVPNIQQDSILEWPRLLFLANTQYNFFKITMVTAAGAALGLWISQQEETKIMADRLILVGGVTTALYLFGMSDINGFAGLTDRSWKNAVFTSVSGQMFYVSLTAFLMGLSFKLTLNWSNLGWITRLPAKAFIVTGGLALPVYVFHGLVIPIKNILLLAGMPTMVALILPMAVFVGGMAYAGHRLWRMYFG